MSANRELPEGQLTRPNRRSGETGTTKRKTSRARICGVVLATIVGFIAISIVGAGSANASSGGYHETKTVSWQMPGIYHPGKATWPQQWVPNVPDCTDSGTIGFQVDVYRYGTPEERSIVDALIAKGVLTSPKDDHKVIVSWKLVNPPACAKPDTPVVAAPVTFNDDCGTKNDYYVIPSVEGVVYKVDGSVVESGTHHAEPGLVSVTAEAGKGYELKGDAKWSHEFTDEPCKVPTTKVTAAAVTYTQGYLKCTPDGDIKTVNPTLTIPNSPNVVYVETTKGGEGIGIVAPDTYRSHGFFGQTRYYVAEAQTGYEIVGQHSWKVVFNGLPEAPDCGTPPPPPVFHTGAEGPANSMPGGMSHWTMLALLLLVMASVVTLGKAVPFAIRLFHDGTRH